MNKRHPSFTETIGRKSAEALNREATARAKAIDEAFNEIAVDKDGAGRADRARRFAEKSGELMQQLFQDVDERKHKKNMKTITQFMQERKRARLP